MDTDEELADRNVFGREFSTDEEFEERLEQTQRAQERDAMHMTLCGLCSERTISTRN